MSQPSFRWYRPKNLADASQYLRAHRGAIPIGKGSRVQKRRKALGEVVDLSNLGLDYIDVLETVEGKEVFLGSTTALERMETSEVLGEFAGGLLRKAVRHTLLRGASAAKATLGGELASCGGTSLIVGALMALNAVVRLHKGEVVEFLPVDSLYTPEGELALLSGEIIEEVSLPAAYFDGRGDLLFSESFPQIALVIYLKSVRGICEEINIVLVGVCPYCINLASVESRIRGRRWEDIEVERILKYDAFSWEIGKESLSEGQILELRHLLQRGLESFFA
ncbi:MAG: hypothetical protein D6805_09315 [Planctomycetota bacterium]|nr:MAG: hypothetical protein D6805_09315 [Planctomycetota bacterium]